MNTPQSTPAAKNLPDLKSKPSTIFQELWKRYKEESSYLDKPAKSYETVKPVSLYDEINAMIRIPEIQRKLEAIRKEADSEARKKLSLEFFRDYGQIPELLEQPELSLVYQQKGHFINTDILHVFRNYEKSDLDHISRYRDGKHIIIAVDMSKKRQDITKEFDKILTRINKGYKIPKDKSKNRDSTIETKTQSFTHWDIYDLERKGLGFVEIARKIWPDRAQKSGGNSHSLKNECMTVSRAYNKAKTTIEQTHKKIELKKEKKDYHKNHS